MSEKSMAHSALSAPSQWVERFAPLVDSGSTVLDVACGGGRHARLFAARDCHVEAVDRDAEALAQLVGVEGITTTLADLEASDWPYAEQRFDAVVVANYLYRPHFDALLESVAPGGVLLYETFMQGNERFGKPSNPNFLLAPGELLECVRGGFTVIAFEQGEVSVPKPAMVQRLCAVRRGARKTLPPLP